ncbi:MAG: hypothetical protein GXX92_09390 [Clostridiales bacterium]|nr:hypothetical protein [Clostridiales bacterium]
MKLGNVKVEQVTHSGLVVEDYDQSLSSREIFAILQETFPNLERCIGTNYYHGSFEGRKYAIRIKNVTYLGIPHPLFKKRIQISDDLHHFVAHCKSEGRIPLLLGIYTYKNNVVFCDFNIDDYLPKTANNSSAHVSVNDIREATRFGYFQKTDMFGNRIVVFDKSNVVAFLLNKTGVKSVSNELTKMLDSADVFCKSLHLYWLGTDAYREMYDAQYRNWKQAEWIGFYFEFLFENFLDENPKYNTVFYRDFPGKGKKKGEIDLDVYIPGLDMFGDLKSHNRVNAKGIITNDYNTLSNVLKRSLDESIYFIIACGDATKDKDYGHVTSRFYSNLKGCKHLSYADRMKYSFSLKEYLVLDLNKDNHKYAKVFKQGKNSNGNPRAPKLLFPEKALDNFLLRKESLE